MQKGYIHRKYIFRDSIEHEYYFNGNYGARGEKRAAKRKRTPEEIEATNQANREKKVRHLIKQNFTAGDYFVTMNFGDEYIGRSLESLRNMEIRNFLARMRREYKKTDIPFKFIIRMELGARKKRPHIHIIMNRIPDLDQIIRRQWRYGGKQVPHFELINDEPDTPEKLADYITKPTPEQQIEANAICDGDLSKLMNYSCSRNLTRPVPETKVVRSKTMHSIFNKDLHPAEGYYIDKNPKTLKRGINPFTGMTYLYYQEIRLKPKERALPIRLCECPICHQLAFEGLTCYCQRKRKRRCG